MTPITDLGDWQGFFAAQIGATAALLGLLFVGLSLNLTKILQYPSLPNRALLALSVLLASLMMSSYVLIPEQGEMLLGTEVLVTGVGFSIFAAFVGSSTVRHITIENRTNFIGNLAILAAALLPYIVGGALLVTGNPDGLYWVAAAVIISFVKAIADAWVFLVEINR